MRSSIAPHQERSRSHPLVGRRTTQISRRVTSTVDCPQPDKAGRPEKARQMKENRKNRKEALYFSRSPPPLPLGHAFLRSRPALAILCARSSTQTNRGLWTAYNKGYPQHGMKSTGCSPVATSSPLWPDGVSDRTAERDRCSLLSGALKRTAR